MNLEIELVVTGGTDKTIKCAMIVSKQKAGELQLSREDFTKIAEKLFDGKFTVTKALPVAALKSEADNLT